MNIKNRKRLSEVAQTEQQRLAGDPNVVAVGYGLRQRDGKAEYEVCLQYHVKQKINDPARIRELGSQPVPAEVGGYPTDVLEVIHSRPRKNEGPPTGSRGSNEENPLIGGVSTTVLSDWHSFPTGFGTVGGICFDRSSNATMAVSNAHVWGSDTGKDCIQPWIPTGQYVGAALDLLACGALAFVLDTTVPSPLTAGLAAAAAAAWVAAAASDAEDPSRWGQRTGVVPAPNVRTTAETVRISAPLPDMPFAGRAYSTKARWDYTRHTTAGDLSHSIEEDRPNEHTLAGKLVWTERDQYHPGERVRICAEVISERVWDARQYFVVAACYPLAQPDRVVYRVLTPGRCKEVPRSKPVCLHGFPSTLPSAGGSGYSARLDSFGFESGEPLHVVPGEPGTLGDGLQVLSLPKTSLRIVFPPSTEVTLDLTMGDSPVTVFARNSAGQRAATATGDPGKSQHLVLTAPEMTEVIISGAKGQGSLASICRLKQPGGGGNEKLHRLYYTGSLDLNPNENKGGWNINLSVQTIDPSPTTSDPIASARVLGGITASTGMAALACVSFVLIEGLFFII